MNSITLHGKVTKTATSVLVKNNGEDCALISFMMVDFGIPYSKSEPMFIEVNYMKEPAMHIFDYIKKGKEIVVAGKLRSKNYRTKDGDEKQKYYISADYVALAGRAPNTVYAEDTNGHNYTA